MLPAFVRKITYRIILIFLFTSTSAILLRAQNSSLLPDAGNSYTQWTRDVDIDNPRPEYPRPAMVRDAWKNLNGRWRFALTDIEKDTIPEYSKTIIVPFPVESSLSGLNRRVGKNKFIWYKRSFHIPSDWSFRHILLHIGACDWETTVFVNGKEAGQHRGGYDPFSFDITPYLKEQGAQEIEIRVWDPSDEYHQPRGKQSNQNADIWHTPVSGIWQTVWLEPVSPSHIRSVTMTPDIDRNCVFISADISNYIPGDSVRIKIIDNSLTIADTLLTPGTSKIVLDKAKLWSPEDPFLYASEISLIHDSVTLDKINTSFGMRKISVEKDGSGIKRLFLNNQPYFQLGILDQGYWPDGLYAYPTLNAMRFDIDNVKKLGYNMIRKHGKVEPQTWYHYCDKQGILVWQDMPNSDKNAPWKAPGGIDNTEINREFISEAQFKIEFERIIDQLWNHPSIVLWMPFNEGWGQFRTKEIIPWVQDVDSTRLVGGPSGGNDFGTGDTRDYHYYAIPQLPDHSPDHNQALVIGSFSGINFILEENITGKAQIKEHEKFIFQVTENLKTLIHKGLSAAVFYQLYDVENEFNGLYSYDRFKVKVDPVKLSKTNSGISYYARKYFNKH